MSWQVTASMTGTANRSHSRRWVWACLRDQRSWTGSRSGVQVMRDQVRARPNHARRAGREPLGDLLQLGGQLRLGRALPVPPLAVLGADRPPRPGSSRAGYTMMPYPSSMTSPPPRVAARPSRSRGPGQGRAAGLRPPRRAGGLASGRLWGFCGDLETAGAACAMRVPSLPAFPQAGGLTRAACGGSRDRTRTYNLPVNSRTLCRLSYAGSRGTGGAEPASATALPGSPAGVPLCRRPAYPCRDLRVAYPGGSRARRGAEGLSGARVAPFRTGPGTYRVRPGGGSWSGGVAPRAAFGVL